VSGFSSAGAGGFPANERAYDWAGAEAGSRYRPAAAQDQ